MENIFDANINIKKIINAIYIVPTTGYNSFNDRPSHCIALHLSGNKNYYFSNGKTLNVKKNQLIYLPKHSCYKVVSSYDDFSMNGKNCYAIEFELDEDVAFDPFVIDITNFIQLEEYFRSIKNIWISKPKAYELKCKALLYNIIYVLVHNSSSEYLKSKTRNIIRPAIEKIHLNFDSETFNVEELAKSCNVSSTYFRKIFKTIYGTTPIKYIKNLKMERAIELFDSKLYTISETAFMSGYTDLCNFSKDFKKKTGLSPSEYIKLRCLD